MSEETTTTTEETEPVQTELPVDDVEVVKAEAKKREIEMKREIESMRAELDKTKKATLREKSSFKELAEQFEKEAILAHQEKQKFQEAYLYDRKLDAVRTAAAQSGMRKEALEDLEAFMSRASEIDIETTSSGRINVLGADRFISRLKSQKPYLFETKGSKVNPETPGVGASSDISCEKLQELRDKATKSNNPKSREWEDYKKALVAYSKTN